MNKKKIKIVLSIFKNYFTYNIKLGVLSLLAILTTYISPQVNAQLIDRGIGEQKIQILWVCLALLLFLEILNGLISFLSVKIKLKYQYQIERDLKNKALAYLISHFWDRKMYQSEGELDTLIRRDIGSFISFVSQLVQTVFLDIVKIGVAVVMLIKIDAVMGCIAICFQVITIIVNKRINRFIEVNSVEVRESFIQVIQRTNEMLRNIRELLFLNAAHYMMKQFNKALYSSFEAMYKSNKMTEWVSFISNLLQVIFNCLVLGYGGYLIIQGHTSLGLLLSFLTYAGMLNEPILDLVGIWTGYCTEKESLDAVFRIFLEIEKETGLEEKTESAPEISNLELRGLWFRYPQERYLLKEVNAVFPKGRLCYLMGKSGEGKSTLIKLMLRFLEAEKGEVLYDDMAIGELLKERRIANYISWVPQEPILFSDSIRNNLLIGKEIDDSRLREVCQKCALHEDIQKMPAGFETMIGEEGEGLSVGQKHRVGLARAFLQDKPIVIIDEGTAGLDVETEFVIKQHLKELCKNKITIIITHSKQLIIENAMVYELRQGHLRLKEDFND